MNSFISGVNIEMCKASFDSIPAKFMIVGPSNKLSKLENPVPTKINNKNVKFVKQHLGVVLDCEMSPLPLYINVKKRIVDRKIGTKYSSSPHHKGTILLWNKLSKEVQDSDSMFICTQCIDKTYKKFERDFYL